MNLDGFSGGNGGIAQGYRTTSKASDGLRGGNAGGNGGASGASNIPSGTSLSSASGGGGGGARLPTTAFTGSMGTIGAGGLGGGFYDYNKEDQTNRQGYPGSTPPIPTSANPPIVYGGGGGAGGAIGSGTRNVSGGTGTPGIIIIEVGDE